MHPHFDFNIFGMHFALQAHLLAAVAILLIHFFIGWRLFANPVLATIIGIVPLAIGNVGAKLVNWILIGLTAHRWGGLISSGSSYYGGLIFYILGLVLVLGLSQRIRIKKTEFLTIFAIAAAADYAILKLGCLLEGCCYGKVWDSRYALTFYRSDSLMRKLGIPVHPTQIYSIMHGLALALALKFITKNYPSLRAKMIDLLLLGLALGRIVTESFRGDLPALSHIANANVLMSIAIVAIIVAINIKLILQKLELSQAWILPKRAITLIVIALTSLAACSPPLPPGVDVIRQSAQIEDGISYHQMNSALLSDRVGNRNNRPGLSNSHHPGKKNLLFVSALGGHLENVAQPILQQLYGSTQAPRIDDISWWYFAPEFRHIYQNVLRIGPDSFDSASLKKSLLFLEGQKIPYDVILVTHGMANYIMASEHKGFVSYSDLQELSGQLPHLDLVFMQGCEGMSLAPDWIATGARNVIGTEEGKLTLNFFFLDIFMKDYQNQPSDPESAFEVASHEQDSIVKNSMIYGAALNAIGITPDQYLKQASQFEFKKYR